MSCWDFDPTLGWAALDCGIRLSIGDRKIIPSAHGYDHTTVYARIEKAVRDGLKRVSARRETYTLTAIPEPWVFEPIPKNDGWRGASDKPVWRDPDSFLRWDFLLKVLVGVPVAAVMADAKRHPAFVAMCKSLAAWTIERLAPSWEDKTKRSTRQERKGDLYEWRLRIFEFLGNVALYLSAEEADALILNPIFKLNADLALSLLHPFVDMVTRVGIIDPATPLPHALPLVLRCLPEILKNRDFEYARGRDGEIYGHDIPAVVRILTFTHTSHAPGASRFANGDWSQVDLIMPVVSQFVEKTGDIPFVMQRFLTLVENSREYFNPDVFVKLITTVLALQDDIPAGWRHTRIASRIAALIQEFAEREAPLNVSQSQAMLRILDRLVDMGDRRSAALQMSELFKETRN